MQVRFSRAACAAIISAAGCFGLSADAAPTWQVQASFNGTANPTSQTRTARGIALSPDGSEEYLGFIQGTGAGSTAVREYSSGILSGVNPTPDNSASLSGAQPKGVAVDDRGNVFATDSNSAGSATQKVIVYNSSLGSSSTFSTQTQAHAYQLGGIAVEKVGSDYLLYVATNKGSSGSGGTIDIYNVDTPSSPTFVSTISLHNTMTGGNVNAQMNGLDVAPDGTIYATADDTPSTNTAIHGDTVYKIDNTGAIVGSLAVTEAMDDVLYNGELYVAEYNADNSAIGVVDPSTMTLTTTWNTGFSRTSTPTDSGYAGITANAAGQLYVVDETYTSTTDPALDRVLVSSPVPEPASLSCLAIGGLALLRRRRSAC